MDKYIGKELDKRYEEFKADPDSNGPKQSLTWSYKHVFPRTQNRDLNNWTPNSEPSLSAIFASLCLWATTLQVAQSVISFNSWQPTPAH